MKPIRVVITDLDDTLWDWVAIWYKSFKAMLDCLVLDSGISRDVLIKEIKSVYEKHQTSEYSFVIAELPSLQKKHPGEDLSIIYANAIRAYRLARSECLCAYPCVIETLKTLKDKGVLLVGYTESMSFYTRYRIKKLKLDQIFDYLYSPKDHELPGNLDPNKIRHYPPEHYILHGVVQRFTPSDQLKPAPEVLRGILDDIDVDPDEVIYIGDKLHKDIMMAHEAKVIDVWAKYGEAKDRQEYELLREVTHWTDDAVQKEKDTNINDVKPTYTLRNCFAELLEYFEFAPFVDTSEKLEEVIEIWKKTIDVQQHFNDIELKIRNLAITLLIAVIGASGFSLKEDFGISIKFVEIPFASILMFSGAIGLSLFWFMDRCWYHRFLLSAVKHSNIIEQRHIRNVPEIGLSLKIKEESPIIYKKRKILHSDKRLDLFYLSMIAILIIFGTLIFFLKPILSNGS